MVRKTVGGWPEEKIGTNFGFGLRAEQRGYKVQVILIDGNGSQDIENVDLGKLK